MNVQSFKSSTKGTVPRQAIYPLAGNKQTNTNGPLSIHYLRSYFMSLNGSHTLMVDVMKRLNRSHTETHQRVKCVLGTDLEDLE